MLQRKSRQQWIWGGMIVLATGPVSFVQAQETDRSRAATEAANQATEADRLLKLGEFAAAMPLYEAERASRAITGDIRYEAYALRAIGICQAELGDDATAIATWKQAYSLDLKRDDPGFAGYDDFLIGQAEARLGRFDPAITTLERALTRLGGAADRDHEIDARLALTRLLVSTGRAEPARPHARRALELAEATKDAGRTADAWASLGQVEGGSGHPDQALVDFSKAQALFEQQGRAADAAWMETTCASSLLLLNRLDEALTRYEKAAELHKHLADGGSTAEDLAAVAGIHLEAGRLNPALKAAEEAVNQARDADDRVGEVQTRVRLAQVQAARNEWAQAAETLDEAVTLGRQIARDDPFEQVRILLTAAATDSRAGLKDRSEERLKTATQLADESKSTELKQTVLDAATAIRNPKPAATAEPLPPPPPMPPR